MIHTDHANNLFTMHLGTYSQALKLSDESTAASSDVVPSSPRAESNSTPSYTGESRLHLTCLPILTQDDMTGLY